MSCSNEVEELARALAGSRYTLAELVSVLLAVKYLEPIGRVFLSRVLGIGDKKARNLIRELRGRGLIRVTRGGASLSIQGSELVSRIKCETVEGYTVAALPCDIRGASILYLRDKLVLLLGGPEPLIAIGHGFSDAIEFPGLPPTYEKELGRLARSVLDEGTWAIALFDAPQCYTCCSSFLQAVLVSSSRSATMSRSL